MTISNELKILSETKEMLEAILSTIDEGIHVVNKEGITIFYNQVAAKHDGLKVDEVIDKHLLEVFPSLNSDTSTLLKAIETGKPIFNQHQKYTNKNGQRVETVNTTLPMYVKNSLVGAVEIAKDITRIKELSEKMIDLQAQFREPAVKKPIKYNQAKFQFNDIITKNSRLEEIIKLAKKSANTDSSILIEGETGTGKELLVQAIHNYSPRNNQPFIAQNCAAIPSSLLEAILFGTVKGSFTGAENRPGLFELSHNGTLFLDEINSMPADLQAKLLRVLQDGMVRRVGDTENRLVNVRIIVAINVDSIKAVESGQLRSDLYYRINVINFKLPPLRERKEDIPLLTRYFIQKYNYRFQKLILRLSPEVELFFNQYDWPGNVRELEHAIEYVMNVIETDTIELSDLPPHLLTVLNSNKKVFKKEDKGKTLGLLSEPWIQNKGLKESLEELEQEIILSALRIENNNVKKAAKRLKIPRQTLQYKIRKFL